MLNKKVANRLCLAMLCLTAIVASCRKTDQLRQTHLPAGANKPASLAVQPLTPPNPNLFAHHNVSTIAGMGFPGGQDGGVFTGAQFNNPAAVIANTNGTVLYVADEAGHKIRKVNLVTGEVTTVAGTGTPGFKDGPASSAQFNNPCALAFDQQGALLVADRTNHRIRRIVGGGLVLTLAGNSAAGWKDGYGTDAQFYYPSGIAVDEFNNVYVADQKNHRIRRVTPEGLVQTIAGDSTRGYQDGTGTTAHFNYPYGIAYDKTTQSLYVADASNNRIRKVTTFGSVTTVAGSGTSGSTNGAALTASFKQPIGIAVDASGTLYVADKDNNKIRMIKDGLVTTMAGNGIADFNDGSGNSKLSSFKAPAGVYAASTGLLVADGGNNRIRKIDYAFLSTVATIAGNDVATQTDGQGTAAGFMLPHGLAFGPDGTLYIGDLRSIRKMTPDGMVSTLTTLATTGIIQGLTVDASGNIYVSIGRSYYEGDPEIWKISPSGVVSLFAGSDTKGYRDGPISQALFYGPGQLTFDAAGNMFVAEWVNGGARKISTAGQVSTVLDTGSFHPAMGICVDPAGNIYEGGGPMVKRKTLDGTITDFGTVEGNQDGSGTSVMFSYIFFMAADAAGYAYICDEGNNTIRKLSPDGVVTTLTKFSDNRGFKDGDISEALIGSLFGIAIDENRGILYFGDADNHRIRTIQ